MTESYGEAEVFSSDVVTSSGSRYSSRDRCMYRPHAVRTPSGGEIDNVENDFCRRDKLMVKIDYQIDVITRDITKTIVIFWKGLSLLSWSILLIFTFLLI